jgi:hypothetical protein
MKLWRLSDINYFTLVVKRTAVVFAVYVYYVGPLFPEFLFTDHRKFDLQAMNAAWGVPEEPKPEPPAEPPKKKHFL